MGSAERELAGATLRAAAMPAIALSLALMFAVGCNEPVSEARHRAVDNWNRIHGDITYQLAEEAFRAGSFDAARIKLMRVLETQPGHRDARILLAQVYIGMGATDDARRVLSSADPADPETSFYLGVMEEMSRNYDAAAGHFRRAVQEAPSSLCYLVAAVEVLLADGRVDEAEAFLSGLSRPPQWSPRWFCLLAEVARARGDLQAAAGHYERARGMIPAHDAARAHWLERELAAIYTRVGRYRESAALLESLLSHGINQDSNALRAELIYSFLRLGEFDRAESVIEKIDTAATDTSALWIELARGRMAGEQWRLADRALQRVAAIDPNCADALMLNTLLRVRLKEPSEAVTALSRWRAACPHDPLIGPMRRFVEDSAQ